MKIAELTGAALDWAVAKCEAKPNGLGGYVDEFEIKGFSTDWAQGGPIIERELIELQYNGEWKATNQLLDYGSGTAPLIAAMRCYVASKLGEDVDVPTELTGGK